MDRTKSHAWSRRRSDSTTYRESDQTACLAGCLRRDHPTLDRRRTCTFGTSTSSQPSVCSTANGETARPIASTAGLGRRASQRTNVGDKARRSLRDFWQAEGNAGICALLRTPGPPRTIAATSRPFDTFDCQTGSPRSWTRTFVRQRFGTVTPAAHPVAANTVLGEQLGPPFGFGGFRHHGRWLDRWQSSGALTAEKQQGAQRSGLGIAMCVHDDLICPC